MTVPTDPQLLAEAVRDSMRANDRATRHMGIEFLGIAPGEATMAMTVREFMLNGHDICHGGFITTLADTAFAYACNAYNEVTVASGFDMHIVAPARRDDVLTARCTERFKSGRTGVYDVEVVNQSGQRVAMFRGRSYTMKGKPVLRPAP